ncbi:hypothetical protein SAMN04488541_100939 [Thermoflexibacter ruber]|uniref:Uncharacterized protein n=1 Tax=Thermoflexibacter ruber TaxID=1003 RepID=A0A1I2E8J4_9BACT|nr:hypothetical protein SAMN04488541_100939 [Thermoflexibacter ruber]
MYSLFILKNYSPFKFNSKSQDYKPSSFFFCYLGFFLYSLIMIVLNYVLFMMNKVFTYV